MLLEFPELVTCAAVADTEERQGLHQASHHALEAGGLEVHVDLELEVVLGGIVAHVGAVEARRRETEGELLKLDGLYELQRRLVAALQQQLRDRLLPCRDVVKIALCLSEDSERRYAMMRSPGQRRTPASDDCHGFERAVGPALLFNAESDRWISGSPVCWPQRPQPPPAR